MHRHRVGERERLAHYGSAGPGRPGPGKPFRRVTAARILETVYGGFCYAIVIGDGGWHRQEIHYKTRGILSGQTSESRKEAELMLVDTGRSLPEGDIVALAAEVKQKIRPMISTQERFDKGCT